MNIDARNKAIVPIEDVEELAGLSEGEIAQCKADAEANDAVTAPYAIVISNTTQQDILASLENRATREKVFNASYHRSDNTGNQNTYPIIADVYKRQLTYSVLREPLSSAPIMRASGPFILQS